MKKQLALFCAISLLAVGVVTISSCKKSNNATISGTYAGTLSDSLSFLVNDTMVITASGNTVNVTDKNTGSTFSGTLGTASTAGGVTTTPITFTNAQIKQGTSTVTYTSSGSSASSNYFQTVSASGVSISGVSILLSDSSATTLSTFSFSGNKD